MSRSRKREAESEIEQVGDSQESQGSITGLIGGMALRERSVSNSSMSRGLGSRSVSVASVISVKSSTSTTKIVSVDGDKIIDAVCEREDINIASVLCIFEDKTNERFVPPNTQFSFNPRDDTQKNEVKTKLSKLRGQALNLGVSYKVSVLSGWTDYPTITKVGGASMNYTTRRFPPANLATSWLKNSTKKPRKPRTKKVKTE
jgi:hypothetical protein